jgi:hypothetical protein
MWYLCAIVSRCYRLSGYWFLSRETHKRTVLYTRKWQTLSRLLYIRTVIPCRWNVWNIVAYCSVCVIIEPITVASRSKAWTIFARSNAGIVGSNPTQGMDVCVSLFCVYVVLCAGRGLAMGWSPVQRVLPTVYRIKKLKKRPRSNKTTVES